jgi:light-harvesting complex I chlorophyll a/b binding protein 1|mmetsp:Transcript_25598/g.40273  ORF Transcript_25598/g.40273 Transcript_25598/m.40273 type:complete len:253 (-) Transcript_25598:326-1084(-)|eukprot:CAMPEP_0201606986 /NCGR_PEP_ID=MMETSP0492-20130828/6256_1 /ASSEMBLY_ACC=CAM_ASM_000837 /TAXON_ID=420259 /ORGANISM="Thalassiosira gravida, Strain GMp14c1" /LENGTH=252 /DNA_ID=CAMNT_0048071511 /DNA_START=39 /DNA_END=797 /DNA_ORIENTATION=-
MMKVAALTLLAGSAAAFAPAQNGKATTALQANWIEGTKALPFGSSPDTLDGSLPGDVGFDPIGFSTGPFASFNNPLYQEGDFMTDLEWLREAELAHGRIAQLAVVGFIWPGLFGTFPGSDEFGGVDAYSELNPFKALEAVPESAIYQIVAGMAWFEYQRVIRIKEQGANRVLGDIGVGYPGGWNPFNINYTPEEYADKQVQEIKHCRLAMIGAFGLICQAANSGTDVVSQLSPAFAAPEYAAKAGYFLPQGI